MIIKICVGLFLLLGSVNFVHPTGVSNVNDFDLLIFTQLWPATDCKEWKKRNPHHTCNMPKENDIWTIHGIWPTKFGTIGPQFCNGTWLFDPEKIRPIEDQLEEVWINVFSGTSIYALWAHEWSKHGTCAAILELLNSEFKYFSLGIDLLSKYSMTDILKSSQIVPSDSQTYSVMAINDAIKNKLGVDPAIECKREDGKNYISEIRICFDKQLKNVNCDGIISRKNVDGGSILTNCHPSEDVVYPHYSNNKLFVEMYKLVNWLQWVTL